MNEIEVSHPSSGIAVVELHGEHDCGTSAAVRELLAGEISGNELVIVDVSEALFIDTSLLHNLLRADEAATARGSRFVLQMGTTHIVRRALEISGLLQRLDVAHSRDDATGGAAVRGGSRPRETKEIGGATEGVGAIP